MTLFFQDNTMVELIRRMSVKVLAALEVFVVSCFWLSPAHVPAWSGLSPRQMAVLPADRHVAVGKRLSDGNFETRYKRQLGDLKS